MNTSHIKQLTARYMAHTDQLPTSVGPTLSKWETKTDFMMMSELVSGDIEVFYYTLDGARMDRLTLGKYLSTDTVWKVLIEWLAGVKTDPRALLHPPA